MVNTACQLPQAKPETTSKCADHGKLLEIFCCHGETCDELISQLCTVIASKKHRDHHHSDAYTKHRRKIEANLPPLNQRIKRLKEAITVLDLVDRKEEIEKQGREAKDEVHQTVVQFKELLDQTKQKLNKEVDEAMAIKLRLQLGLQEYQTKEATMVLSQLTNHVQQTINVATPHQLLATY